MSKDVTYYYTDPQGTVLATASANGDIISSREFHPFGKAALGDDSGGPGFTNHYGDGEAGFIYMQARYMDPDSGRFLSADPESFYSPQGRFERFSYADNNPLTNVDPDGRESKVAWLVKLTATGMRRIARLTEREAVAARRSAQNVEGDRRLVAQRIETKAFPQNEQLEHKGHSLPGGETGKPHFQTDGKFGHTFWGILAVSTAFAADTLDNVAEAAAYVPDPTPAPATTDDIYRANSIIDMVNRMIGSNFDHISNDHVVPPDCGAECMLRDPQKAPSPN